MRPLYIFDLDGTVALCDHRRPILDDLSDSHRWQKFYAACVRDTPNRAVIKTMELLYPTADVRIWSGRSYEVFVQTIGWLQLHAPFVLERRPSFLRMRNEGDYTPDEQLKQEWLKELSIEDRRRLVAAFDDRDKVVQMWRSHGIACFQVAPGEF